MFQVRKLLCKFIDMIPELLVINTFSTTYYVTPCPVTKTVYVNGNKGVYTTETDSTVYTTYTATVYPTQKLPPHTEEVVTTVM